MTITDEISIIANKLAKQGKQPTVALVKARLTKPVPLPTIIDTLKSWQYDENFVTPEPKIEPETSNELFPMQHEEIQKIINESIDKAIIPLKNELSELKDLLQKLMKKR